MSSKGEASLDSDGDSLHQAPPEMPLKLRWMIYVAGWVIALGFTFPDPRLIIFLPYFPLGLFYWIDPRMRVPEQTPDGALPLLWIGYLIHGVFTLKSRTRLRFGILSLVLALILGLNVVGCHQGLNDAFRHLH